MTSKKASAQIWWIIIGAVIALVVLVVLMVIFVGRTTPLNQELANCESKGGVCTLGQACPKGTLPASSFTCSDGSCCLGAPTSCDNDLDCGDRGVCSAYGDRSYCL